MVRSIDYIDGINESLNGREFRYGTKLKKELRGLHEKWKDSGSIDAFLEYMKKTDDCSEKNGNAWVVDEDTKNAFGSSQKFGYFRGKSLEEFVELVLKENISGTGYEVKNNERIEDIDERFDVAVFDKSGEPKVAIECKTFLEKTMFLSFVGRSLILKSKKEDAKTIIVCCINSMKEKGNPLKDRISKIANIDIEVYTIGPDNVDKAKKEFERFIRDIKRYLKCQH